MATFQDPLEVELASFDLSRENIEFTNEELGRGSYATVYVVRYHGLKCAGKKIHGVLQGYAPRRFREECLIMSKARHPKIVQFLGLCFQEESEMPLLIMEYLPINLYDCLRRHKVLPEEISYSILQDIALGLAYLHGQSPPIIHRDISASNILLTSNMSAKIGDLGVARIKDLTRPMTSVPGTPIYMPPEVMTPNPHYDSSVDVFSFGVLALHVLTAEMPTPKTVTNVPADDENIEIAKREKYFLKIGTGHALSKLILRCLKLNPAIRPLAPEIAQVLNRLVFDSSENRVELQKQVNRLNRQIENKHKDIERITWVKQETAELLQRQVADLQDTVSLQRETITAKEMELNRKSCALNRKTDAYIAVTERLSKAVTYIAEFNPQLVNTQVKLQKSPKCANSPNAVAAGQCILIGQMVYYGGGVSGGDDRETQYIVCQYNLSEDSWDQLPVLPVRWFGLGQLQGRLVTVGGISRDEHTQKQLYTFSQPQNNWLSDPISPMPTARHSPAVLSHPRCLIVAGGDLIGDGNVTNIVEIYNVNREQWMHADNLPYPCRDIAGVVSEDTGYILGGYNTRQYLNRACKVSIDSLIRNATATVDDRDLPNESLWEEIANTPLYRSSVAAVSSTVVALGGREHELQNEGLSSGAVYAYSPLMNSWIRIGDLPAPVKGVASVSLSPAEFIVIGGMNEDPDMDVLSTDVYRLTLIPKFA